MELELKDESPFFIRPFPIKESDKDIVDYVPMQDLSIGIKTMPQAFGGYHLLLVLSCDQTNFTIAVLLRNRQIQTIAEALIYRVIYLFSPKRQILCDKAAQFTSAVVQAILTTLNCRLKVISPYNHGSSKCERQIKTISEMIKDKCGHYSQLQQPMQ